MPDSAGERVAAGVTDYLSIKTLTSLITGLLWGVLLAVMDGDFPALWGLLAFILNFVPNIGSIIAAIPPVLLALIQFGPGTAAIVGGGSVVSVPLTMGVKIALESTEDYTSVARLLGPRTA